MDLIENVKLSNYINNLRKRSYKLGFDWFSIWMFFS